jgi:hypothetical protein
VPGSLVADLRPGLRGLFRAPAFATVAVRTPAPGMAANTAIFTVIDAVMLDPLPYAEPERRVMIWNRGQGFDKTWTSPFEARVHEEGCPSLEPAVWLPAVWLPARRAPALDPAMALRRG